MEAQMAFLPASSVSEFCRINYRIHWLVMILVIKRP